MDDLSKSTDERLAGEGVDLDVNDPLPDIPDAGDDSVPITSPDPIDFSTDGITAAGSIGMSTFNDDDDRTFFERTVEAFEEADIESPMLAIPPLYHPATGRAHTTSNVLAAISFGVHWADG
jgi:hypothetical protein